MSQKFGGKHSPTPASKFRGRRVQQSNVRVKLLFLAPLPLLFAAFAEIRRADASGMIAELGAFAILILAAWLLRDGLKAETAFRGRTIARPPAIPRKIFASVLTAVGVYVAAQYGWGQSFASAVVFGLIAGGAHSFSFGIDPLRRKGMDGVNDYDAERVAKAVDKAEGILSDMLSAAKRIGDRAVEGRVESLATAARDMFRTVEEDPRDLTSARKFMGIYLKGARDATIKFVDFYAKTQDNNARQDYLHLLDDLEASFNDQRETMLLETRTDLDVEIEVLRDRLKQEGLHVKA